MKLTIFNKSNSGNNYVRTGIRSIGISRTNNSIIMSQTLKKELNLTGKHTVCFAKDEDSKAGDWFISFSGDENGFELREKKNGGFAKGYDSSLYFCNKFMATKLLDAAKAQKSVTLLVSEKPVQIGGQDWFKIVLSKPLRIN